MKRTNSISTTHTPGPWNIYTSSRPDGEYQIHTGTFDESEHIASVSGGLGFLNNDGEPFCFESAANARLIAAAPELLAALEAVTETLDDLIDRNHVIPEVGEVTAAARAAIAKAEGDTA